MENFSEPFTTRRQRINHLQEGQAYGDGSSYTLGEYQRHADSFKREHFPHLVPEKYASDHGVEATKVTDAGTEGPFLTSDRHACAAVGRPFVPVEESIEFTTMPVKESNDMAAELERSYWDVVDKNSKEVTVDYGNDIDAASVFSGFPLPRAAARGEPVKPLPAEFDDPEFYRLSG